MNARKLRRTMDAGYAAGYTDALANDLPNPVGWDTPDYPYWRMAYTAGFEQGKAAREQQSAQGRNTWDTP